MAFQDFRIIKLAFDVAANFKGDKSGVSEHEIENELAYNYSKKAKILKVLLGATVGGKKSPYALNVQSVGVFKFEVAPAESLIEALARVNCPAIMYPYVRETIADVTRRAGFRPLHLQPVNFTKLYRESIVDKTKTKPSKKIKKSSK
jgi:preprotein translocase subunit SecB